MKTLKITVFIMLFNLYAIGQQTANEIVLEAAKSKLGTKVWSGICFDLIDYSLRCADPSWKKRSNHKYVYGKRIKKNKIQPGDIVLYKDCKFKNGVKALSHVAIICSIIDNNKINVIEQNYNARTLKESRVVINSEDISKNNLIEGKLFFYRPYSFE